MLHTIYLSSHNELPKNLYSHNLCHNSCNFPTSDPPSPLSMLAITKLQVQIMWHSERGMGFSRKLDEGCRLWSPFKLWWRAEALEVWATQPVHWNYYCLYLYIGQKYINIKSCNTYLKQGKSKKNLLLSSSSSNWKSHLYHQTINTNF